MLNQIKGSFNHEQQITQALEAPMVGSNWGRAFSELIANAYDAKADSVQIEFGTYDGAPAIFVSDNGVGLNTQGLVSYLSYGFSSRSRSDTKTIGTNGTGGKFGLALGDINETKITTISVNSETGIKKIVINKQYLLLLASGADQHNACINLKKIPVEFNRWPRESGVTVILTGYDPKRVSANLLAENLCHFMSPRALAKVVITSNGNPLPVLSEELTGNPFEFSSETKHCGLVELNLFYGGQGEGPKICGQLNQVMDFAAFAARLTVEQRKQIGRLWANVGGHIYIPNINLWRTHDGTLSQDFYKEQGACDEIVEILAVVSDELRKLIQAKRQQAQESAGKKLVSIFSSISKKLNPEVDVKAAGGNAIKEKDIKKGIFIVPRSLHLETGKSQKVLLTNVGEQYVSFINSSWSTENPDVALVLDQLGPRATLYAGRTGKTTITITNSDGKTHKIKVVVGDEPQQKKPYIYGPGMVQSNIESEYRLAQFTGDGEITWKIQGADGWNISWVNQDVVVVPTGKVGDSAVLTVFSNEAVVASRTITIGKFEKNSDTSSSVPVVVIGGQPFEILVTSARPEAVSIMPEWASETGYPVIALNPLHPIYDKYKGMGLRSDSVLTSLGFAGINYLVSTGGMTVSDANNLYGDFIETYKSNLADSPQEDRSPKTGKRERREKGLQNLSVTEKKRKLKPEGETPKVEEKRGRGRPRKNS
jgi:hypothetical protein